MEPLSVTSSASGVAGNGDADGASNAPAGREDIPPALAELQQRRDEGERFPAASRPLLLSSTQLGDLDLSGLDLSEADLSYCDLARCDLSGSRFVRARLTGCNLSDADLAGVELLGTNLDGADLSNANLASAALLEASAIESTFFGTRCGGASFNGANLTGGEFRAADLIGTSFIDCDLSDVDFATANLRGSDLSGASVLGASFREADLQGSRLRNLVDYSHADWIDTDITDADFQGAWNVRRVIQDVNYIHEFRTESSTHALLYWLWWVTSDCGRSLLRWALWSVLIAVGYALAYTQADLDWGGHDGPLGPLYFSVVTFTTLGFGDVTPRSTVSEALVMSEVVFGYLSLGGMMSILSDKMARRAG